MSNLYKNTKIFILMIIIILALVFGFSLWFQISTDRDVKLMSAALDEITLFAAEENYEKTLTAYEDLHDIWEHSRDHWYYYLNHATIKETDLCVVRMGEFIKAEQYGDALSEQASLRRILHEVGNHDIPLIHNIV